jgi:enterochelin esterase family protein
MNSLQERVRQEGTPLVDRINQSTCKVTFVWLGEAPAPKLIADFSNWEGNPLELEEVEPEVWTYSVEFPSDTYMEYSYYLKPDITERYPDPFNPRRVWNGINAYNHVVTGPDFVPSPLITRGSGVKRGTISEHHLGTERFTFDGWRTLYLYKPPTDEPVPLILVWDGSDYLNRARLNFIVDNLIASGEISPVALAFLDNAGPGRFQEYIQGEAILGFVLEKVMPFARENLNLLDEKAQPGVHGILGASMGGLMALYGGLRYPKVFGKVLCQSGAFEFDNPYSEQLIKNYVKYQPVAPIKIWQDAGTFEWLLQANRDMNELLQKKGYDVTYHEFHGGHNYYMWSQIIHLGLKLLFGKNNL